MQPSAAPVNRLIEARGLSRSFGRHKALKDADLQLEDGKILGLIGPNGAGKTTLLRALLGLGTCSGELQVLGLDPRRNRAELMEKAFFMADTAVLPRWMKVKDLLRYCAGVHAGFDRVRAEALLANTEVGPGLVVANLSKGMTAQLHLAIALAVDARLLVLDEPTLGLDIIFRKQFYDWLHKDFFSPERSVIISTHQVEEVESILTDVAFMNRGRVVFQSSLAEIESNFVEVLVGQSQLPRAEQIPCFGRRTGAHGEYFIFQDIDREILAPLGELSRPSTADLFLAVLAEDNAGPR